MTVIEAIRESVKNCTGITNPFFVHGRDSDIAIDAAKELVSGTLVYLEPITKTKAVEDSTNNCAIVIGFLTQDSPDSKSDKELNEDTELSMEEKVDDMETQAEAWLTYFFANYKYRISGTYTFTPIFRVNNVMTGGFLTFTLIEPKQC